MTEILLVLGMICLCVMTLITIQNYRRLNRIEMEEHNALYKNGVEVSGEQIIDALINLEDAMAHVTLDDGYELLTHQLDAIERTNERMKYAMRKGGIEMPNYSVEPQETIIQADKACDLLKNDNYIVQLEKQAKRNGTSLSEEFMRTSAIDDVNFPTEPIEISEEA